MKQGERVKSRYEYSSIRCRSQDNNEDEENQGEQIPEQSTKNNKLIPPEQKKGDMIAAHLRIPSHKHNCIG